MSVIEEEERSDPAACNCSDSAVSYLDLRQASHSSSAGGISAAAAAVEAEPKAQAGQQKKQPAVGAVGCARAF